MIGMVGKHTTEEIFRPTYAGGRRVRVYTPGMSCQLWDSAGRGRRRAADLTGRWRWEAGGVCEKGEGEVPVARL